MKLRSVFRAESAREEGYSIDLAEGVTLAPFDVVVQGVNVRIVPHDSGRAVINGQTVSNGSLYAISAEVDRSYGGPLTYDENRGQLIITRDLYQLFHAPAFEALQRTMLHLRSVTNDPHVDQYLSTLVLWQVFDAAGKELYTHDNDPEWRFFNSQYKLSAEHWDTVIAKVKGKEVPAIEKDLLLNARAFMQSNNYSMALINAAMACEISLHRVIRPRLVGGEVTQANAEAFTDRLPVPKLLTLLRFLQLASQERCDRIQITYTARNKIVHGKTSPANITRAQAETATTSAQFLQDL